MNSRDDDTPARPGPRTRWRAMAGLLGFVLVALTGARVTGIGERLFYFPSRADVGPPPAGAEDVWIEREGGPTLHGWFFRAAGAGDGERAPTIVHCHGNAGNVARHVEFVRFLPGAGFNVLIFDYRGYGKSERGRLRRDNLVADAIAAVDHAAARDDVDPARIGVYGLSLGGTIGLAASAEDDRVRAVCSVATFSAWREVARDFSGPVGSLLIRPGRDAVASVAELGPRPLLLLHGDADEIVSPRHAPLIEAAACSAGVDVELRTFRGAGHVNWVSGEPAMPEAIIAFFRETLAVGGGAGAEERPDAP